MGVEAPFSKTHYLVGFSDYVLEIRRSGLQYHIVHFRERAEVLAHGPMGANKASRAPRRYLPLSQVSRWLLVKIMSGLYGQEGREI